MTIASLLEKYAKKGKRPTYAELIQEITAHNTEKIARTLGRISETRYRRAADRALGKGILELPPWEEVMKPQAYFLRKAKDSGAVITDTLRRRLTGNLRDEMSTMEPGSRMSPEVIDRIEKRMRETLGAYTKSQGGAPPNARMIATLEARTAFNETKYEYAKKMALVNSDRVAMRKRWIHNQHLVRQARPSHVKMHGKSVGFYEAFVVDEPTGWVQMMFPHDPMAPISSTAGCQCDYDIEISLLPGGGKGSTLTP
jgi:hypothetical protein